MPARSPRAGSASRSSSATRRSSSTTKTASSSTTTSRPATRPTRRCWSRRSNGSSAAPGAPHGRSPPTAATAKQGVEDDLRAAGVRYVVLPTKGRPTAARRQVENRRAFRKMVRWRTGCEGRISCAKRDFGLEPHTHRRARRRPHLVRPRHLRPQPRQDQRAARRLIEPAHIDTDETRPATASNDPTSPRTARSLAALNRVLQVEVASAGATCDTTDVLQSPDRANARCTNGRQEVQPGTGNTSIGGEYRPLRKPNLNRPSVRLTTMYLRHQNAPVSGISTTWRSE